MNMILMQRKRLTCSKRNRSPASRLSMMTRLSTADVRAAFRARGVRHASNPETEEPLNVAQMRTCRRRDWSGQRVRHGGGRLGPDLARHGTKLRGAWRF